MGFLDAFRRPVSLLSAAAVAATAAPAPVIPTKAPPTQAQGIPGGGNFSGRIVGFEPNEALREQAGFGRAGTYEVGQWQEMVKANPYVAAGLDFIVSPVADARVGVEPAKSGIDEATAQKHADFIEWAFTEGFRLSAHLEAAAKGFLLSGFSLFEPVFAQVQTPTGPAWGLKSLAERLPNSLDTNAWLETDDGQLKSIRQSGPIGSSGKWERPELDANRVLLYSWKRQGNNWAGESQLRACWYAAAKTFPMLMRMVGVTLQREGAGLPVATPMTGVAGSVDVTPEQREEIMTLFANLSFHEAAGLVMPPGWEFDWKTSSSANKGHLVDVMKSIGLWVLMQLSAQQLFLGTDSTGSRSVGEVHDARAMAFVRKVLAFIEGVLNGDLGEPQTGLVKRLIDFNFGPQPAYPRVKLTPQRPELSPKEQAEAAKTAKAAGLFTPVAEDENSWRERAGFQPITEEERAAAKEAAAALAPQLQPGFGGDDDGDSAREGPAGKVPGPKGKQLQASAQRGGWAPWRTLRASEAKVPWAKRDAYFTQQRDVFEKLAKPVVMGMLATAAPAIERAMADGNVTPAEVAAIPFDTRRLDAMLRAYLIDVRKAGAESLREELSAPVLRAAAEEEDEREDEKQAARDDANDVIEAQAEALKRRMESRLRGELEREAIDTMRTGGGAAEVVSRIVAKQFDTGAFKADAGYVTTKAFSVGREEAAQILGGVESVTYSAILDSATCVACYRDDGRTVAFNSPEHDAMLPPNRDCSGGDNCRCLLLYERGDS